MKEFYYEYEKKDRAVILKQYIYRMGTYHYNWHRDLELLTVIKGKAEVCTGGVSRIMGEDDLILINSNEGHTTLAKDGNSIAMVLHLDPVFFVDYYDHVEYLLFHLCSQDWKDRENIFRSIRRDLARMMLCYGEDDPEHKLMFEKSFYNLTYTIVSQFPPEIIQSSAFQVNQKKQDAVIRMVRYINKNYKKRISLDSLAKETDYNPSYVSQLFKSYVGINFYDYLTRIRLREATRELSQTDKKILEIALEHGFSDLKAFNMNFKENFRKSPTEYRKMLNQENTGNDAEFKKKFLEREDPVIRKKLFDYMQEDPYEKEGAREQEWEKAKKHIQHQAEILEQMSRQLKDMSVELKKI